MPPTFIIGTNGGGDTLVYRINEDGVLDTRVPWLNHENNDLLIAAEDFADLELMD